MKDFRYLQKMAPGDTSEHATKGHCCHSNETFFCSGGHVVEERIPPKVMGEILDPSIHVSNEPKHVCPKRHPEVPGAAFIDELMVSGMGPNR